MKQLILEEWLSLDGFAEDRHGKLDFFPATEVNKVSDQDQLRFLDSVDTILLGRKTYELFVDYWPTATTERELIADRLNALPKLVFSNSLTAAPWGTWEPAQVIRGDAVAEIRQRKAADGGHMVLWGSLSLASDLISAGLFDQYRLHICPTVIGAGRRLFPESDKYQELELKSKRSYDTGVIYVQYEPRRQEQPVIQSIDSAAK